MPLNKIYNSTFNLNTFLLVWIDNSIDNILEVILSVFCCANSKIAIKTQKNISNRSNIFFFNFCGVQNMMLNYWGLIKSFLYIKTNGKSSFRSKHKNVKDSPNKITALASFSHYLPIMETSSTLPVQSSLILDRDNVIMRHNLNRTGLCFA